MTSPRPPELARQMEAAEGYIDLGMYREAHQEVDSIAMEYRMCLEVIQLREKLYAASGATEELAIIRSLLAAWPKE